MFHLLEVPLSLTATLGAQPFTHMLWDTIKTLMTVANVTISVLCQSLTLFNRIQKAWATRWTILGGIRERSRTLIVKCGVDSQANSGSRFFSLVRWYTPLIPALRSLRQEDLYEFKARVVYIENSKASQIYIVRTCLPSDSLLHRIHSFSYAFHTQSRKQIYTKF